MASSAYQEGASRPRGRDARSNALRRLLHVVTARRPALVACLVGPRHYQYDDASNLVCVDCGTGTEIAYSYDGNNRRVTRTQSGVTTYYVTASNGDLILEYTLPANRTVEHIYVHGKHIASKTLP